MMTEKQILDQIAYHQGLAERSAYACLCCRRDGDSKAADCNYNDFVTHCSFVTAFKEVLE